MSSACIFSLVGNKGKKSVKNHACVVVQTRDKNNIILLLFNEFLRLTSYVVMYIGKQPASH